MPPKRTSHPSIKEIHIDASSSFRVLHRPDEQLFELVFSGPFRVEDVRVDELHVTLPEDTVRQMAAALPDEPVH